MIKIYCDACSKEINNKTFSCQISVKKMSSIFIPGGNKRGNMGQRIDEQLYHVCESCWKEVEKEINKDK